MSAYPFNAIADDSGSINANVNKLDCLAFARNDGESDKKHKTSPAFLSSQSLIRNTPSPNLGEGRNNSFAKQTDTCHTELVSASQDVTGNKPLTLPLSHKGRGNKVAFTSAEVFPPAELSKMFAFTLAEVLITLGIIGVVATLTMPSLIANYQKKVYVNKLQKAYNTFSNAFAKYKADNETDTFENWGDAEVLEKFARKYFKVSKWCGTDRTGCMVDTYYLNDKKAGSYPYHYSDVSHSFRLTSGEAIRIVFSNGEMPPAWVQIDINGPEGPNVAGRDFFIFDWYDKGLLAACRGKSGEDMHYGPCKDGNGDAYCAYCFGRMVVEDGWQMRY